MKSLSEPVRILEPSAADTIVALKRSISGVVHGKDEVVELAITAMLAGGHVLLEDVPGVGKTTLAHALAQSAGGSFARVQFTADLLPGDITGANVLDPRSGEVTFRRGPLFANVVLADEINRTSPKTQSALFEAMAEGQVTVDGLSRALPSPFLVVATQNPYDHHGTYALPDSQLDRFLMRLTMGYPDRESERAVLRSHARAKAVPITDPETLSELIESVDKVMIAVSMEDYLLDLVRASRNDPRLVRGVSPRGARALLQATRARALVKGRDYAVPEDLQAVAVPVLAHRVLARRRAEETLVIDALLDETPVP